MATGFDGRMGIGGDAEADGPTRLAGLDGKRRA